jgi:AGZA family xanthine/uracil permease-like MFS transporter
VGAFLASLIDHPAAETSSAPKIELTWSAVASGFSAHPGIIIGHALSLALLAFFDSAATVLAVRSQLGRVDERRTAARSGRVLAAAGTSSVIGSVLGTSMLVPYVESTAGVLVGGRTGLTAIICGLLFVAALFMGHVVELFGAPIPLVIAGHAEPIAVYPAIAAPLMLVGIAMLQQARFVQWSVWYESIPAVLTMAVTGFSASIPHGIAFGVVSYVLLNLVSDPKRVRVPLGVCALFFILWLALS